MRFPPTDLHGAYLRRDFIEQCGRRRLAHAIKTGEVRPLWTGVVVEAARLLDPRTQAAAAQLSAGPRAGLTGSTAAFLHGCTSVDTSQTHVVLPYGHGVRSRAGLVVHHAGFLLADTVDIEGLRVLSLDRVIANEICTSEPRAVIALVDEALRLAGGQHEELRTRIAQRIHGRQDPRGTVSGAHLLDLATPRAESAPESWLRLMLVDHGFPLPEVNWRIRSPAGQEIYRLDLAWPSVRIAVEYDGYATHADREEEDEARDADLRRRGWIILRVRAADLADMSRLEQELTEAFAARGYVW